MLEHEAIVAAVSDPELAQWVSNPRDYTLDPAKLELGKHRAWRVNAIELSHPMSFYLVDLDGGGLVVTSDDLDGLAALIRRDPALFDGPEGAERLVALASPVVGATRLVASEDQLASADIAARAAVQPPKIGRAAGGWEAELFVVDDLDRLRKWRIAVPDAGAPSWDRSTLAADVGGVR